MRLRIVATAQAPIRPDDADTADTPRTMKGPRRVLEVLASSLR